MKKFFDSLRIHGSRWAAALLVVLLVSVPVANAQLRIATWNTATAHYLGVQSPRTGSDIVLESIGEELIGGVQRPIDVLILQEQWSMTTTTKQFADLLNGIYGTPEVPTPYKRSFFNAFTSDPNNDAGGPGLIWNTTTVAWVDEAAFGTVNGSNQARSTMYYQMRPLGYGTESDFYIYNSHYKAGSTTSDKDRREIEATSIRENPTYGSDNLGEGAHAIYAGDYNIQSSSEDSYQTLLAAGAGQAFDPINTPAAWHDNASYAGITRNLPVCRAVET